MTGERKAVLYLRVSTSRQADEGVSLEAQLARLRAWCSANGYEVVNRVVEGEAIDHYRDALSGKRADNRPGLMGALNDVCRVKGVLVVYSLSRLGRSTMDLLKITERLRKSKADLCSLTEKIDTSSAMGEFFFTILAAIAQFERRQIGERVRATMAHCRQLDRRISRFIPFGYELKPDGESLAEVPEEQAAIARAMELHQAGLSYGRVAATLNAMGVKPRRTEQWGVPGVKSVLKRERLLRGSHA